MRATYHLVVKLSLTSLVSVLLVMSCNGAGPAGDNRDLSLPDFEFLRLGMSYQEVVAEVGEAKRDVGSGIHLMVYELKDGTEMMLSFPSLDSLAAVYHFDPETNSREQILGPGY